MRIRHWTTALALSLALPGLLANCGTDDGAEVCEDCKQADEDINADELIAAGMDASRAAETVAMKGKGCRSCSETGFRGRVALYEVMVMKDELKEFVLNGASALELKREAMRLGMASLRQSALNKLHEGITTLGEVLRVSAADQSE